MKRVGQGRGEAKGKKGPDTGRLNKKRFGAAQVGRNVRQERSLGREAERLLEDKASG